MALHRSLLPTALPAMPGLDLAARYVTGSGTVGGDWHDVFILPDGRLGVVVEDVAGSGLEAADPATALRLLDRKIQYFEPDAASAGQPSFAPLWNPAGDRVKDLLDLRPGLLRARFHDDQVAPLRCLRGAVHRRVNEADAPLVGQPLAAPEPLT
ncbi:MAG TPA: hypothetical protein VHZ03_18155 [Trebonia sp.]|nr:hypothetical protein [Trebonia sp.]